MSVQVELREILEASVPGGVRYNVPLKELSQWKIGGRALAFVRPRNIGEVAEVFRVMRERSESLVTIGATSNILFDSAGFDGVLLEIGGAIAEVAIEGEIVRAGAGVNVPALVRTVAEAGLTGIEHAAGVPGTLGGLVLMNGGTQRKGIGAQVERIVFVDGQGRVEVMMHEDLGFAYRRSSLQGRRGAVCTVELRLARGDRSKSLEEIDRIVAERAAKFPLDAPSCGSTFLSDPAMYEVIGPPGKVIEEAGLKGRVIGGAMISAKHANFIINTGEATSDDVLNLIGLIRREVRAKTGFVLDCEVRYLRRDGLFRPAHEFADSGVRSHRRTIA